MQARGDDRAVLAAVGVEPLEGVARVGGERADADGVARVLVGDAVGGHVLRRHVDVGDGRVGRGRLRQVREHGVDRRRQAAREEGGHADREQQVDRRPVTAADRAVALEVLDRLRGQQVALVAVERDEDRAQVAVQREAVAHAEQGVHEPPEAEHPGVLRDRLVLRRVAVDGADLEVDVEVVALALRAHALAEPPQQVDEVVRAVQADTPVADEMPHRRDALDVVADVRRPAPAARMGVVEDPERPPSPGRRRRGGRVGIGGDPGRHPVAVQFGVAPRPLVFPDVAVEDREQLARERALAEAVDGGEDVEPGPGARLRRVVGRQRAQLPQRRLAVHGEPGAGVLGGREAEPQLARDGAELLAGALGEAAPERDDAADQVAERGGVLVPAQRLGERLGARVLLGPDQRARLGDDRVVEAPAALERPHEPACRRLRRRRGGALLGPVVAGCGGRLARADHRPAHGLGQVATGQAARGAAATHGRRAASRGARAGTRRGP